MGRGARMHHSHRRYIPPPPEPVPQGVGGVRVQGSPPVCGCPCCHNGSQIVFERTLPPAFTDVYTQEEWSALVRELDRIIDEYVMPMCPCIFTHFCLPFSPVCAILCCASKQKKALAALIAKENQRLEPQGLYWTYTPARGSRPLGAFLCLSWRPDVRPVWEAANPSRRPISREPLPAEFYSEELKMAVAMAQVQQQAMMLNGGPGVQMVPMYAGAAAAPAQGYGGQAWGQPPPQPPLPPAYPAPVGSAPSSTVYVQPGPHQQSMGSPSAAAAQQPWSPSAPVQQPQWTPPSQQQQQAANTDAAASSPEGSPSPLQVKRFCAGCGAPRADPNGRFCAGCGAQH